VGCSAPRKASHSVLILLIADWRGSSSGYLRESLVVVPLEITRPEMLTEPIGVLLV